MLKVNCKIEKQLIDCYPEAQRESLPMFAENRVHQRTSGNPYPNKIVLESQRAIREKCEFTVITLENEFIEIAILPELGGKVWYAKDKKKDYNFFYKNNVVKPALIGVLGSWTSGGLEFNWPFHHRASTFMPVDYTIENNENGGVTVWLSEHDPIDRMKGMVGIVLNPGETVFETRMKVDNTTSYRKSFLWWENAAVPVNESYEIFFPEDVKYVNFHYKRSVTTYPVANNNYGNFNGIVYNGDTKINEHKNTKDATSYFSAESKFDFFGGYDNGLGKGVVHVANHNIAPGKKMFTWAYNQLAKTWENALTDTDGQYAELMAGSYSDNQPDFGFLEPFESKSFSQYWFPISGEGVPCYANINGSLYFNDKGIVVQPTKSFGKVEVIVKNGDNVLYSGQKELSVYNSEVIFNAQKVDGLTVLITKNGEKLFNYTVETFPVEVPPLKTELRSVRDEKSARALYLQGLHAEQYRSPEYSAEEFYKASIKIDEKYYPSLIALANIALQNADYINAEKYLDKAEDSLTDFTKRLEDGKLYYLKGILYEEQGLYEKAYKYFYKASWNYAYVSASMTHIGLMDIRNNDYKIAVSHFNRAIEVNVNNVVALAFKAYAEYLAGDTQKAKVGFEKAFESDKLNLYAKFLQGATDGYKTAFDLINTDLTGLLADAFIYYELANLSSEFISLTEKAKEKQTLGTMAYYTLNYLNGAQIPNGVTEGIAFPVRNSELKVLLGLSDTVKSADYYYLLGSMLYHKKHTDKAIECYEKGLEINSQDYRLLRNLATAYYSRKKDNAKAVEYMLKALKCAPKTEKQIVYETVYLLLKTNAPKKQVLDIMDEYGYDRDDTTVEYAKTLNMLGEYEKAIKVLMDRVFVACEGGEHFIADQYTYAYYKIGERHYNNGEYEKAIKAFDEGVILPQSLGSGFWNRVKKVPCEYAKALCLLKLGKTTDAEVILNQIANERLDFFSNMYLNTLPYYKAKALKYFGKVKEADELIESKLQGWLNAIDDIDCGAFSTTPFFINFIDDASFARKVNFSYLVSVMYHYLGKEDLAKKYAEMTSQDGYILRFYPID